MSATHTIPVQEDVYREVTERAFRRGVSPEQWASNVLAEHARLERLTDEYFDRRAENASSLLLGELLDKAPARPPDPGDRLED